MNDFTRRRTRSKLSCLPVWDRPPFPARERGRFSGSVPGSFTQSMYLHLPELRLFRITPPVRCKRPSAARVWKEIADGGEKRNFMYKSCPSTLQCGRCSWQCWKFTDSPGKCALNLQRGVQGSGQDTQFHHEKRSCSMQMQGSVPNGRGYVLVKNPFQNPV